MQEIKTNPTVRHTTPLQLLAAFAATVAVLFVLLLGACALPAQPVLEHVYDSAQTIQQEGRSRLLPDKSNNTTHGESPQPFLCF